MEKKANNFSVAGLVLGIVACASGCAIAFPYLGLPAGIVGIILSVKARKGGTTKKGMATAGLVLSIIGVVFAGIVTVCVICALAAFGTAGSVLNDLNNLPY